MVRETFNDNENSGIFVSYLSTKDMTGLSLKQPRHNTLRCMVTAPFFSANFTNGDNFCDFMFAYLDDRVPLKLDLLLKERIYIKRS